MTTRVLALLIVVPLLLARAGPASAQVEPRGVWPLSPQPAVAAGFDPPDDPWGAGHRGVDLAGSPGQAVRAAMAGRVGFAGLLAGKGVVVVDHGDTRTTYEPVTATLEVGDEVSAGDMIGRLTVPFSHCFPRACLHWGWRRGDLYLDPLALVGDTGPVRLLPLWRDEPAPLVSRPTLPLAGWWRLVTRR
jgi:murein DD-endopeptidase MepM/ murein hydrolase activator NlpD